VIRCSVLGIGVFGPGLPDWTAAQEVLCEIRPYVRDHTAPPSSTLLPAAERRRATPSTRLALTVAQQALTHANISAAGVPAVFGSSSGNPDIIHDICAMLADGDYQISPTKFHNSVHNAASGYYSIAVQSHCSVTSLCAFDDTAVTALFQAAVQAATESTPVLMVSYDLPYPFPLSEARPTVDAWAISMVLAPAGVAGSVQLTFGDGVQHSVATEMADPLLNRARIGNPTARLLPLLAKLAQSAAVSMQSGRQAIGSEHIVTLHQSNGRALSVAVLPG
jgi:hypothetical protein